MSASMKSAKKSKSRGMKSGTDADLHKGPSKRPVLKIQVELADGSRLGPGKIMLLEAIDRAGSLSRGADEMGISYRRAWLFMKQINQSFDQPAISTPAGGHGGAPCKLTEFGRQLIEVFRKMEADAEQASSKELAWLTRHGS